jgi:hypothetical protein
MPFEPYISLRVVGLLALVGVAFGDDLACLSGEGKRLIRWTRGTKEQAGK